MRKSPTQLLADFVDARERGDRDEMYAAWRLLVPHCWEHVEKQVEITGRQKLWSDAERQDALSEAGERLARNVPWVFDGTTLGELIGCAKAVARVSCLEVQRDAAGYRENLDYLDATVKGDEGEIGTRADTIYADRERKRIADEEADEAMREESIFRRATLDWALPQLSDTHRTIIKMLMDKKSPDQIAEALDMKRNTVDVYKKRALEALHKLIEQYRKEQDDS